MSQAPGAWREPGVPSTDAQTPPSASVPVRTAPALARDAIIYIPGLMAVGLSLDGVARRLAVAMDNSAPALTAFRASEEQVTKPDDPAARFVTVLRRDGDEESAVVDVYEFDYRPFLTARLSESAPYRQAIAMAWTLFWISLKLKGLFRRSQRTEQRLQTAYGLLMFATIFTYLVLLVGTAAGTAADALIASPAPVPGEASVSEWWRPWVDSMQTGVVAFTLFGFTVRFSLKDSLAKIAPALSSSSDYLTAGAQRNRIVGELTRLIDQLDERNGAAYRKVHLLTYSFGSVVALDALFPSESDVPQRMQRVDTLVTVGCPFDFVRTYWPQYFRHRRGLAGTPARWVNVYSEVDVLGSNFLDEPTDGQSSPVKECGIDVGQALLRRPTGDDNIAFGPSIAASAGIKARLKLIGFRAHSMYWDQDATSSISCFEPVVKKLFASDGTLS